MTYKETMLRAKYDHGLEIGCDGCGETWTTTCYGFKEAARSLEAGHGVECISCNDDLNDKFNGS